MYVPAPSTTDSRWPISGQVLLPSQAASPFSPPSPLSPPPTTHSGSRDRGQGGRRTESVAADPAMKAAASEVAAASSAGDAMIAVRKLGTETNTAFFWSDRTNGIGGASERLQSWRPMGEPPSNRSLKAAALNSPIGIRGIQRLSLHGRRRREALPKGRRARWRSHRREPTPRKPLGGSRAASTQSEPKSDENH